MNDYDNRYDPRQDRPVNELTPLIDYEDLSRYELTPEEKAYEEMIRRRIRERRRAAERRRIKRNRTVALVILLVIVLVICRSCYASHRKKREEEAGAKVTSSQAEKTAKKKEKADSRAAEPDVTAQPEAPEEAHKMQQVDGLTFVDGILIVNKTYSLPEDYAPGLNTAAEAAFNEMTAAAFNDGLYLYVNSGYRSYDEQYNLYYNYAFERGVAAADMVSSRPGHSEHQAGLCFDVNSTETSFGNTNEAKWLAAHCAEYGFIIRFPKGKEAITGYEYEPWHIRFVGKEIAQDMNAKGQCLEEYLGVTSSYEDAADGLSQQRMAEMLGVTVEDPYGNTNDENTYDDGTQEEQSWDDAGNAGWDNGYGY
ncbi:M15 family metallopeptidase [Ruminococcus sp.]|uniref:M15 family metallopeptidase n=1 Tax=Ruminococcus sp. TaxID=41978 RepID=UPI0026006837|nr:M15 family metallopeptidase [Ruminococcus sp.]MBQ8966547.1 M15 family metallopeptidase [Ruminococcus sp.]